MASSHRSKESERPHSCTSFPYVHDKLCAKLRKGDYAFKIDLQDTYFHVPIHPSCRKYLRFAFVTTCWCCMFSMDLLDSASVLLTAISGSGSGNNSAALEEKAEEIKTLVVTQQMDNFNVE